jgi:hypothetical protein
MSLHIANRRFSGSASACAKSDSDRYPKRKPGSIWKRQSRSTPKPDETHLNLGIVYVRLNRKEEGEAGFKEALRFDRGLIRGSKDAFKAEYFKILR